MVRVSLALSRDRGTAPPEKTRLVSCAASREDVLRDHVLMGMNMPAAGSAVI